MLTIRFHLASGKHFRHWQVKGGVKVRYYDPASVSLLMTGCRLCNRRTTAEKIHLGASKSVCAWIVAETVEIIDLRNEVDGSAVEYNPRTAPYWRDAGGANVDGHEFEVLATCGRSVVVI